jgi:hypothetical protein
MKRHLPDKADTPPADTAADDTPPADTPPATEPAASVTVEARPPAPPKPAALIEGPRGRWAPPPPTIGDAFDHLIRHAYHHERGRVIDFEADDLEQVRRQLAEQPRHNPPGTYPWRR